jgi:DNA-binding winged helix-turn-helix (wHTH) protein/tetratricopeptide (TPR) repeat protein
MTNPRVPKHSYAGGSEPSPGSLEFEGFVLDLDRQVLFRGDDAIHLRPQSFDVLRYLVQHHGRLVEKRELLQAIWGDTEVTEDSLTHCIIDARKAIGDVDRTTIRTVPRRGFVFDVPVYAVAANTALMPLAHPDALRHRSPLIALAIAAILFLIAGVLMDKGAVEQPQVASLEPAAIEAKDLSTLAHFLVGRRAPGDLTAARQYFERAVEKDPEFADAWAGLASVLEIEWQQSNKKDADLLASMKAAAERALRLDPDHIDALLRLSRYYSAIGDHENGRRLMDRAAEIDPKTPLLLGMMAGDAARSGDFERAIELQRRALDDEPLSFIHRVNLSYYLFAAGNYELALSENRRAYEINSRSGGQPNRLQGYSLILLKRFEEALQLADTWHASPERNAVTAMASFKLGQLDEAAASIGRLKSEPSAESFLHRAEIFAFCEHIEHSFDALTAMREHVLAEENPNAVLQDLRQAIDFSPVLARLRTDERWQDWLAAEPTVVASFHLPRRQLP